MRPDDEGRGDSRHPGPETSGLSTARPCDDTAGEQERLEQFRLDFTERARDTGLQTAERNDAEWSERVFEWIEDLEPGTEVTADDVRSAFGPSMAVGSVFRRASRARLIECIGMSQSRSLTRHAGIQRVWRRR